MDIWNGLSESREAETIRAPDGIDYATCVQELQKTQTAVNAAGGNLTGEVTSSSSVATVDPTAISNKTLTTIVAADHLLFVDDTDGQLKKAVASDLIDSLPSQSGHSGEYLTTDGSSTSWDTGATAITTATALYVSTTGNDTTGDGSSGSPWATIHKALDYLADKTLLALVTIYVEAGDYGTTGGLVFDHPQGQNIYVKGDYLYESVFLTGTNAQAGYVDYSFTSSNTSRYHVGYFVLCHNAINGNDEFYTNGVMEVLSVVGSVVTLRHTGFNSGTTTASGPVLMTLLVPEVKIDCNLEFNAPSRVEGLYLSWTGTANKYIDVIRCFGTPIIYRCVVANANGANNRGWVYVKDGCSAELYNFGLYGTKGIYAWNGSFIRLDYCAGTGASIFLAAYYGSAIYGDHVSANGGNKGFSTYYESVIRIANASPLNLLTDSSPVNGNEGNYNSYLSYSVWS